MRDLIRDNETRRKNWTCSWFHTDYFITEYLFSLRLTSFKSRHVKLSIDIFLMSLCEVFAELQFILVTQFKKQFAERVKTENAPGLFSLFFKSTKFSCYYESIQIKVDPLQIRMVYCSYLYDQKWQSNSSSFRPYQENLPQNAYPRLSTPEA